MERKLKEGSYALDFTINDIHEQPIKLSSFEGKKIILSFYRNVNCPFCNRRIHAIMGNSLKLQNSGVKMILMFESSNKKLSSSVFHQGVNPWPLVGDPEKIIYKKYGVESSLLKSINTLLNANPLKAKAEMKQFNLPEDKDADQNLIPADFFIDENFKIVKAHYGKHIDDHVSLDEILKFAGAN
jgi:peroxiredoxin Q/BCP